MSFQQISRCRGVSCANSPLSQRLSTPLRAFGTFKTPPIRNEPNPSYEKGSKERQELQKALASLKQKLPVKLPPEVSGRVQVNSSSGHPSSYRTVLVEYPLTTSEQLIATKYRYNIMAATTLGQGKHIWHAEIDSAAGSFPTDIMSWFNVHYATELLKQQNTMNDAGVWNRTEYRPLEGFVYAISPFNFTAIGVNLTVALAIKGIVVIWKPSDSAVYSSWLLQKILEEAALPEGAYSGKIAKGVASGSYVSYPRIIGVTGGKNFHLVHGSADIRNAVNTTRGAFEYQGQKHSAISRLYVAESVWPEFKKGLIAETENIWVGSPEDFSNVVGPVIHGRSWEKLDGVISKAKADDEVTLLTGGHTDKSEGWYIQPTIFQTTNPHYEMRKTEFFRPLLTAYVYPDAEYKQTLSLIDKSIKNFYINSKRSRASSTNDKATSTNLLSRFTSIRSMKEDLVGANEVESNIG
ncbi:delta 1-pyrroline-5-carboxylate dehydrogenase-like protein [Dactylonectria macrodidyma]|uniref:Delta 1-pyrroline-5-carboxylate dehydrogenase-like protein n=1 Tax=Dactylonectria macrodidyma TaxID=307937 RepID=A0A9P9DKN2_9HYPO|nr:delta 1-pyrroline-5-carboxylate dehydrogenase-like protein [Dactylonectria macrodidyma]